MASSRKLFSIDCTLLGLFSGGHGASSSNEKSRTKFIRSIPWRSARTLAQPDQQDESQAEPASLHHQVFRQNAACHHVMPVVKIVDKSAPVTRPLLLARAVLEVVHVDIRRLPFLQRRCLPEKPKFKGWYDEMKAFQLDRFSESLTYVKADGRTGSPTQGENHETLPGCLAARYSKSLLGTIADRQGSPASSQLS